MNSEFSDDELVRRTLSGDLDAFAVLVHRHQDAAYAAAYSLVQNFHDAKDIVQEAWIKAYRRLVTFDQDRHFGAWLYGIGRRCAIDWLRSRQVPPIATLSAIVDIPDPAPLPDAEQERKELSEVIHRALSSLSQVNRETTVLYYIDGYSQRDVGEILGVPLGTVKRRLHDSRKLLQKEVLEMVGKAFEKNKLEWRFTQDVIDRVAELRNDLTDYLPQRFQELAQMSKEELRERRMHVLRSLAEALSISAEEVEVGKKLRLEVADLSAEQKEYVWQTLHELELMDILSTIREGASVRRHIEDFSNVVVEVGRYDWPEKADTHNKLYVAFHRLPHNWLQMRAED